VLLDLPSNADVPAAQLAERPPASGTAVWLLGAPPPGATSGWTSDGKAFSNDAMVADTRTGPTTAGLVETDAASTDSARGGALVDGSGKVAGIVLGRVNARATTKTYAVRIDVAIGVAQQLDANGAAEHGSLGMRGVDTKFGPMVVAMAKDTPAAQAGMRVHDLVTTVDGHAVRTIGEMTAVVRSLPPGRHVVIALRREGRAMEIRAKLGATTAPTATAVTTVAATVRAGG
jgi:S1-C subfamily serine protease